MNGIKLYYEIQGSGKRSSFCTADLARSRVFGPNLEALAKGRLVIGVDLQVTAGTADIDRPLSVMFHGRRYCCPHQALGRQRADVMGYSSAAVVALLTAIRHTGK